MDETFEVLVDRLVYGGDGLARLPDGRAVFVPFALPGERVRIALVDDKKRFARATLLEILETSPERISPRCIHYGVCGGCHYQHLSYADQLKHKEAVLREQLDRIGGFNQPNLKPIVASPNEWFYRNRVQFHPSEEGALSFVAVGGEGLLPISECYLPMDALNALWPQLDLEPLPELERVALRQGADEQLMVVFESTSDKAFEVDLEASVAAVQIGPNETHILADDFTLTVQMNGRDFRVSAGSFCQVNTAVAEKMVAHILDIAPFTKNMTVLDVYCGVGLFSAFIAPQVERLIGIELSASACADFEVNLDAFENVELYEAAAEDVLPGLDVQPDVVLVDPPRAGLDGSVLDAIVGFEPGLVVYISCDPATLARDGKRLREQGYQLEQITPFDMFPQTYHIESISLWKQANA
jgi:23S rRNA (uracil1939-C5)-methyltransferase